jgi:hypothetical protein
VFSQLGPRTASDRVDFSYAFATPHRVTLGRPDNSDRTLVDLQPGYLKLAWTYEDLTGFPLASFVTPPAKWKLTLTPQVDGEGIPEGDWSRLAGYLPALHNRYQAPCGAVTLRAVGAESAMLIHVTVENTDAQAHQFMLRIDSGAWGENPAWVNPARWDGDNIVAGWGDRADRVMVMGVGADGYSLCEDGMAPGPKSMVMVWEVPAGETRTGWVVRPYRAYDVALPLLRTHDWSADADAAVAEWDALLDRAAQVSIPDPGVAEAYRACLADLFIMREPVAGGYLAAVPGTEVYRAANPVEAGIVSVVLDEIGLNEEAFTGYRVIWGIQGADGNWNDPEGWGHLMWASAGFKAWAAWRHWAVTGDRGFLEWVYPHMLANSRFQECERRRTRVGNDDLHPLTYGLMPRGMGDCGLKNDDDLYGYFLPHNIWAVYADKIAVQVAEVLGKEDDLRQLRAIYDTGRRDLLEALERGAIEENGFRWIPGTPAKTSGSRWGVLNALTPTGLLPGDHELVQGTLRKIESWMSPGSIPVNTGWLTTGMWVAITLDNVAEAHLELKNSDAAAQYLYATLNHATPLVTWCEERGQEPGTTQCTGDRQHLWTPVAVARCVRDCLVLEDGDGLELALGTDREWLASAGPVGMEGAPTDFGTVSYRLQHDAAAGHITGWVALDAHSAPAWVAMHLRLPEGWQLGDVKATDGATLEPTPDGFRWLSPRDRIDFTVQVSRP